MRPLKLSMTAFGPYAGRETLDFTQISRGALFLIHGPTGSGKTSILDAICYALYGDSSGRDRPVSSVRSDHAPPDLLTEVSFDFALGDTAYRVFRRPDQERPKRKGKGTTRSGNKAVLWRLGRNGNGMEEEVVLASRWKDVTGEVERLLGFRSEQFRQVVILPQGEFRRLLNANSTEREEILQVLFGTEFYKRVEQALKDAASDLAKQIGELRSHKSILLEQAAVESEEELSDLMESLRRDGVAIGKRKAKLKERHKQAMESLEAGKRALEILKELEDAHSVCCRLRGERAEEFREKEGTLRRGRDAAALMGDEEALSRRLREAREAGDRVTEATRSLEVAAEMAEAAEKRLQEEQKREGERAEAERELARLEDLTEKVTEMDRLKGGLDAAEKELSKQTAALSLAKEKIEKIHSDLEDRRRELRERRAVGELRDYLRKDLDEAERRVKNRKKLDVAAAAIEKAEAEIMDLQRSLKDTTEKRERARVELESLRDAWVNAQAAVLAANLEPGQPCPVCGSRDHPRPATSKAEIPDDTAIQAKSDEVERLLQELAGLTDRKQEAEVRLAQAQASLSELKSSLGEFAGKSPEELRGIRDKSRRKLDEAMDAADRVDALEKEIHGLEQQATAALEERRIAEEGLKEASATRERAYAVVENRRREIPEEFLDLAALEETKKSKRGLVEDLKKALDRAEKDLAAARERLSGEKKALEAAREAERVARERMESQQAVFREKLKDRGFADRDAYESAKLSSSDMEGLESEIASYRSALSAAESRLERAETSAQGVEKPDMESLEEAWKKADEELEKVVEEEAALTERVQRLDRLASDVAGVARRLAEGEKEYEVIGKLAEVASGTGSGSRKITFQRFVLAALLDDVLASASERLRVMSQGRYLLQRSLARRDRRMSEGLDLEVYDMYTDAARSVKTLSGGESFLASLALSLGLADVVQSYSGGIELDTIFIDEGFGSLDPEALDHAYRALADLRQSGRLVGIISHVLDLKEQCPVRVEVTSTPKGSSVRLVTG